MLPRTIVLWQSECKLQRSFFLEYIIHFSRLEMINRHLVQIIVLPNIDFSSPALKNGWCTLKGTLLCSSYLFCQRAAFCDYRFWIVMFSLRFFFAQHRLPMVPFLQILRTVRIVTSEHLNQLLFLSSLSQKEWGLI